MCYKELASICSRAGISHTQDSGTIVAQRRVELIGEGIAWTAGSVSLGTSALNHEIVDDPVEIQAFVEVLARILQIKFSFDKADEVGNCHRNLLIFKAENNIALLCIDYGIKAVCIFITHCLFPYNIINYSNNSPPGTTI